MKVVYGIVMNIVGWGLIIWGAYTGRWGWAILLFFGFVIVSIVVIQILDPNALAPSVRVLTDTSPLSVSIEINRPAHAICPAVLREFGKTPRRSIIVRWRWVLHKANEKIVLEENGAVTVVTYTLSPTSRWGDGSFGYTLLPSMNQRLGRVKGDAEKSSN